MYAFAYISIVRCMENRLCGLRPLLPRMSLQLKAICGHRTLRLVYFYAVSKCVNAFGSEPLQAEAKDRLRVIPHAHVTRVIMENGVAIGVEAVVTGDADCFAHCKPSNHSICRASRIRDCS